MFQTLTNHLVQSKQVIGGDTFTIRGIHDDNGLFLRLFKLLERLQFQCHILGYACRFYIMCCYFVRFRTVVISVNLMRKFALLAIIIVNLVEHLRIEIHPFLKCESFAEYSRSDVSCYQCCFHRNRSRTAHRVNQVTFAAPSCHQNHTGSQYFVQRSFYLFLTVSATMKRFSGRVQRQRTSGMCNVNIEQYIRIIDAYRRTFACLFAEIIHNSILHLIRYKLGMTEFLAEYNCIYRKRLVYIKILFPWNSLYLVVNFISILCRKILDRF